MNKKRVIKSLLTIASAVSSIAVCHANPTTTFVPISNGNFDDPNLSGFTTYAYRVTTEDKDWTNSSLAIFLESGSINHLQPNFIGSKASVNGLGDTAVFAPLNSLADLRSGFSGATGHITTQNAESPTKFYADWFNTSRNNIGKFDIGMITLSDDANGSLDYSTLFGDTADHGPGGYESIRAYFPDYSIVDGKIVELVENPTPIPYPEPETPNDSIEDPEITTTFEPIKNGKFDDPTLEGFNSFAMRIHTNDDWVRSNLKIGLSQGTLNHIKPGNFQTIYSVNGLGDTAVMAPLNELGDLTSGFTGDIGFDEQVYREDPTYFNASWISSNTKDIGTFDVAIITLSEDARGVISYRSGIINDQRQTIDDEGEIIFEHGGFNGLGSPLYIRNGQIFTTVPEPGSVALTLLAAVCLLMKRAQN